MAGEANQERLRLTIMLHLGLTSVAGVFTGFHSSKEVKEVEGSF